MANDTFVTEYFGRKRIEVSLDAHQSIKPGDSGAFLTVETEAVRPIGMVVAGA
jgi:hypothetical protein